MGTSNNIQLTMSEHLISEIQPDLPESLGDSPRLRLWDIENFFKCPVIGWCLDIAEQREILRKEGVFVKDKSDFEAHGLVVDSLESENPLSRKLDFWLNRKYKKELKELSGLAQEEFIRQWEASLDRGEVEGILWAAVTKSDLSREARRRIFGDVHMEMHARTKQMVKEREQFAQEKERSGMLSEKLKEANRRIKTVDMENKRLQEALLKECRLYDDLERKNSELKEEFLRHRKDTIVSKPKKENEALQKEKGNYLEQIASLRITVRNLEDRNRKLLSKLNKQRQKNSFLLKEMEKRIDQDQASNRQPEQFLPLDLSQTRILIVGGLPKMEFLYRRLIEESRGMFDYHDGQVREGIKELEHQVIRADVILCPVDHNSHAAALAAKRFGKKHKKPVRMLPNSSLSTISQALLAV